ncbi:hypothetical protein BD769DRAFT_1015704 [Suillus cothurnatus]|nr:hypothetical protein BD769DRAFT_1015704 [Suillus cothurnatus]
MMHTDEDSTALAESMRVLRSRSNGRIPISRLPDDILFMVFELLVEEKRLEEYTGCDYVRRGANFGLPACLEVTHVCRHWRNVALERPTLWTCINVSSTSPWLDVMFERSQKAPLIVTFKRPITVPCSSLMDCFEKVLLHLPRIKHLELNTYPHEIGRVMDLLSSQPASLLERLKFNAYGRFPPTVPISNPIFQAQVPLLRHLEINQYDRRWPSYIFGGLRTLCVRGTSLPDLLSALRYMPALEQFMFQGDLLESDQPVLFDKVPLTQLKSIAIQAMFETAVSLFTHLALPVDVKIALTLLSGLPTLADLFSVMPVDKGSPPVLRSMRAIRFPRGTMSVQFSTSAATNWNSYSWNPQDDDIQLSIEFTWPDILLPNSAEMSQNTVFDICQTISQCSLFSIELESMHLVGCPYFVRSLTTALRTEGSSTYASLHFLELRRIPWFDGDELRELRDVLKMRAQHNIRLHNLRFKLCNNFAIDPMVLREVVVNDIDRDQYTLENSYEILSRKQMWH